MNLKDICHVQETKRLILMLQTLIRSFYFLSYRSLETCYITKLFYKILQTEK